MKKILYVEDNEDNVYVLKSRLARAGYTVLIAADGAQGVAMAVADPSRAARLLGWRARRDLDAICADAWRWACSDAARGR